MKGLPLLKYTIATSLFILLSSCASTATVSPLTGNTSRTDLDITTNVQTRIAGEAVLSDQDITVNTYERVVTLTGTVENPTQKNVAYVLAKSVPCVKSVKSYITIRRVEN